MDLPGKIGPTAEKHYLVVVWKELWKSWPDVNTRLQMSTSVNVH